MSTDQLETAATALGPLLEEVVFLGGASIHLWLSDPAAPAARATDDVDVISNITSLTAYYRLGERLRERGFNEASDSGPTSPKNSPRSAKTATSPTSPKAHSTATDR